MVMSMTVTLVGVLDYFFVPLILVLAHLLLWIAFLVEIEIFFSQMLQASTPLPLLHGSLLTLELGPMLGAFLSMLQLEQSC